MSKYDGLRKEISRIKAGTIGEVLPFMAMIDRVRDGYQLSIGFWDSKKGSSKKLTPTKFFKFKEQDEAERYLVKYLQDNKPLKPFILFSNEEDIY